MKLNLGLVFSILLCQAFCIDIDFSDDSNIKSGLKEIAKGLMDYYQGNKKGGTVGMMVDPYYWWEAGAAFGSMVDYWYYTGDDQYNDLIKAAMVAQAGDNHDLMPSDQTTTEGNDDQGFWGVTVMSAAERNFTNPPDDGPQWLELAQAVFNLMTERWDTQHCGGGLRWQIYTWNSGYDYKNTVSNGCLFHLAARLARYTHNETYEKWAEKVWNWVTEIQYIRDDSTIYDGGYIKDNCSTHTKIQWTYNYGLYISGAAYMYNYTNDTKWLDITQSIWKSSDVFFKNDVMYEAACQPSNRCKTDQRCFKAIFARFLGMTAQLCPTLQKDIMSKLTTSAQAAAKSCSGGSDGHTCGLNWFEGKWDGMYGLGEQMAALEVMQNVLVPTKSDGPLSNDTGGSSKGDANAGSSTSKDELQQNVLKISTKDRAGAGVLTTVVIGLLLGTAFWMLK